MSVTGRDDFIIKRALAFAIAAIDRVPDLRDRPGSDRDDMAMLLDAITTAGERDVCFIGPAEQLLEKIRSFENVNG